VEKKKLTCSCGRMLKFWTSVLQFSINTLIGLGIDVVRIIYNTVEVAVPM
jgi:hypothetical protein